ncbi:MAG: hypothetical protein ACTSRH_02300 [Promethearchaeota archaeon]
MTEFLNYIRDYKKIYDETIKDNLKDINKIDKILETFRDHIHSLDIRLYERKQELLMAIRFVESFKIFKWIKTCLLFGSYNSIFRDLRFLIESILQAYYIDLNHFNASLESKLEVFKALSEYDSFYGKRLIDKIKDLKNKNKLKKIFNDLSKYVHASYEESKPFIKNNSKYEIVDSLKYNRYNKEILLKCIDKSICICHYILIIHKDFEKKYISLLNEKD